MAVLIGALGGVILGEYPLTGVMALLAGVLFGLAVAEAAITAGKSSDWPLVATAAGAAFAGFGWAAWIEAGRDFGPVPALRFVGALCALASAGWWVRTLGSRAVRSLFADEPEAATGSPQNP